MQVFNLPASGSKGDVPIQSSKWKIHDKSQGTLLVVMER